jgi:hypothetical protein
VSGSTSSKEDQEKLSEAASLSNAEKEKLYDAIGYTEEANYSEYPRNVTFVDRLYKLLV